MARRVSYTDVVELSVPCKPEYVRSVRMLAADIAEAMPLSSASIDELKVAVSEAVSNVVRHAYRDQCTALPVVIVFRRNAKELIVEVSDQGIGFEPPTDESNWNPSISREGGLGIVLIKQLMDGVVYWSEPGQGTKIRMSKTANEISRSVSRSATAIGAIM